MNYNSINKSNQLIAIATHPALWVGVFVFVLFRFFASYVFYYQEQSQLFLADGDYFLSLVRQPGGFLAWLSLLVTALYYYSTLGAFVLAILFSGIAALVFNFKRKNEENLPSFLLAVLAPCLLSLIYLNYQITAVAVLGIFTSLFLGWIFYKTKAVWIGIVLWPVAYFALGFFAFLVLLMQTILLMETNQFRKGLVRVLALWILAGLTIWISHYFLFFQTYRSLLTYPFQTDMAARDLRLFVMSALLVVGSLAILRSRYEPPVVLKKFPVAARLVILCFTLAGVILLASSRVSPKDASFFKAEKLFNLQEYKELVACNRQSPPTNQLTNYCNNVALSELGMLCDEFFSFPQNSKTNTLFLPWENNREIYKRGGYFYYSIGMVNEARRWAYEFMVMKGYNPEILKMLIRTELVNGNLILAKKYLAILSKSPFYRTEAQKMERFVEHPEAIEKVAYLGDKHALLIDDDFFVQARTPEINLEYLCLNDSANKKAEQYKLAYLLWKKEIKGIVEELPRLKNQNYQKLPRHVEEAVVAYKLLKLGDSENADLFPIDPVTVTRFREYYTTFTKYQNDKAQAQNMLFSKFGNTFWYYVFFG